MRPESHLGLSALSICALVARSPPRSCNARTGLLLCTYHVTRFDPMGQSMPIYRNLRLSLQRRRLTVLAAFSTFQLVAAGPVLRARRPAPSLTHLSLCNIPYTDALASAVHAAAPHLSSLTIASDLSSQAALAAATPGLDRLITTCAPSLTSLTFSRPLHSFPWPLADAIAACTRLQHLQLSLAYTVEKDGELYGEAYESEFDSAERIAETASALPALRSFDFEQCNPRIIVAYGLLGLTRLTSLRVNGLDRETMEYFVRNALRPLSNLVRLTLHGDAQIDEDDLRLLAAGCGQLMSLTFEDSFWLEIQGGAGQQQGGGRRRNCIPLPAALRELHLGFRIEPWALLALQLPPGLTRLTAADLRASFDDQRCNQVYGPAGRRDAAGGGHHVGPAVGAGGHGGLQPLASPCPGFDDLLEAVQLLCEHGGGGQRELTLWHDGDYYSPRAWPEAGNGHVRLFAALRPLRLRKLLIGNCCALGLEDVMALAEQLPEVEVGRRSDEVLTAGDGVEQGCGMGGVGRGIVIGGCGRAQGSRCCAQQRMDTGFALLHDLGSTCTG